MEREMSMLRAGYWAVVPAPVRYDDQIPASAKVLYAELSALAADSGYCVLDTGNDYFARVFKMTEKSIREQLHALADAGHIRIEEQRGNHNVLLSRRIYVGLNPLLNEPLEENVQRVEPLEENVQRVEPLEENVQRVEPLNEKVSPLNEKVQGHIIKNKYIYNPPISPKSKKKRGSSAEEAEEVAAAIQAAADGDAELLKAWNDFAEVRRLKRSPIKTVRTVQLLNRTLEALSKGSKAVKIAILEQSIERSWTGLFALKEQEEANAKPPAPAASERGDVGWI